MNVQRNIESLSEQIHSLSTRMAWLIKHRETLEACPVDGGFCGDKLDFDFISHDAVIQVVKTFGGKWDKSPSVEASEPLIDYTTTFDGIKIRCFHGKPPPSCKIVEVEEDVPAVPAGKKIVRKLVCVEAQEAATEPASQPATPETNEVPA